MKCANNVGFADFPWVRRANNVIATLLCVSASVALVWYGASRRRYLRVEQSRRLRAGTLPLALSELAMSDQIGPRGQDTDYLARREAQERIAAEQSADPSARRAHQVLAEQYARRLRASPARAS
jgi:hypothetical protein